MKIIIQRKLNQIIKEEIVKALLEVGPVATVGPAASPGEDPTIQFQNIIKSSIQKIASIPAGKVDDYVSLVIGALKSESDFITYDGIIKTPIEPVSLGRRASELASRLARPRERKYEI